MSSTTVERRYQMIRVAAGDYLLPDNELRTIWRIYSYTEDGSAEWGPDEHGTYHKILGKFWAAARYTKPFAAALRTERFDDDLLDWNMWETWETTLPTRAAAVAAALRAAAVRER